MSTQGSLTDRRIHFGDLVTQRGLPPGIAKLHDAIYAPVADWIRQAHQSKNRTFLLGVNGAQGSGKSTFSVAMAAYLEQAFGLTVAIVSIDDVYHTRHCRSELAERIHPLCKIRGVPGTHDVELAGQLLTSLMESGAGDTVHIPRFDKARDDREPVERWTPCDGPVDVVIFEGWCVGLKSLPAWKGPCNEREARDDPDGTWMNWSIAALKQEYRDLFDRLDGLVMLKVPSMDTVRESRWLQEQKLWAERSLKIGQAEQYVGLMTKAEVHEYVALFERYTMHMLMHLPATADVVIERNHQFDYRLTRMVVVDC